MKTGGLSMGMRSGDCKKEGVEMDEAKTISDYLPLLIPVVLLQLGLAIFCLVDLARRNKTRGPKWMWAIIIIFGELVGPLVYLLIGREE
jgi:DMSO reductase anchor subunit